MIFIDLLVKIKKSMKTSIELLCCHGIGSGFCICGGEVGTVPFQEVSILEPQGNRDPRPAAASIQDKLVIIVNNKLKKMHQRGKETVTGAGRRDVDLQLHDLPSSGISQLRDKG